MRLAQALLAAALLLLLILLMACDTVTRVRGPDGTSHWYDVECGGGKSNCYDLAAEQCPHGYTIADSSGGESRTAIGGYQGAMLIQCKEDAKSGGRSPAVAREEEEESRETAAAPVRDTSDCDAAYRKIDDLVALWADWFQGEAADKSPRSSAFHHVCDGLDEDVQMCLNAAYAQRHHDPCLAKFQALPRATLDTLDSMLLQP